MNPLALLDLILADWASPRVRRLVHALVLAGVALLTIVLSVDGDWKAALLAAATAVYAAANKANTPSTALVDADAPDADGLDATDEAKSYEDLGGLPYDGARVRGIYADDEMTYGRDDEGHLY